MRTRYLSIFIMLLLIFCLILAACGNQTDSESPLFDFTDLNTVYELIKKKNFTLVYNFHGTSSTETIFLSENGIYGEGKSSDVFEKMYFNNEYRIYYDFTENKWYREFKNSSWEFDYEELIETVLWQLGADNLKVGNSFKGGALDYVYDAETNSYTAESSSNGERYLITCSGNEICLSTLGDNVFVTKQTFKDFGKTVVEFPTDFTDLYEKKQKTSEDFDNVIRDTVAELTKADANYKVDTSGVGNITSTIVDGNKIQQIYTVDDGAASLTRYFEKDGEKTYLYENNAIGLNYIKYDMEACGLISETPAIAAEWYYANYLPDLKLELFTGLFDEFVFTRGFYYIIEARKCTDYWAYFGVNLELVSGLFFSFKIDGGLITEVHLCRNYAPFYLPVDYTFTYGGQKVTPPDAETTVSPLFNLEKIRTSLLAEENVTIAFDGLLEMDICWNGDTMYFFNKGYNEKTLYTVIEGKYYRYYYEDSAWMRMEIDWQMYESDTHGYMNFLLDYLSSTLFNYDAETNTYIAKDGLPSPFTDITVTYENDILVFVVPSQEATMTFKDFGTTSIEIPTDFIDLDSD